MNSLYAPIFAKGTYYELQRRTKHGLRDALALYGDVHEVDYLSVPDVEAALRDGLRDYAPDLLFTQIQGTASITADMLAGIRRDYPDLRVANWNGDVYLEHLTSPDMLDILRHIDVQLTVNGSALDTYAREGIRAFYCPFGYETPVDALPGVVSYEVLFLGNNYSEKRQALYLLLRSLARLVGIYGSGWGQSDGECNYDFATAEALYQNAVIAISDNQFPDARGYLSDRPIQILAAGGAVLFQQRVADLFALTGLRAGVHYVEYVDTDDLYALVTRWLKADMAQARVDMAAAGKAWVTQRHQWRHRVEQLLNVWLPELWGERA